MVDKAFKGSFNIPHFPLSQGVFSKQAHVDLPPGTFEEEYGRNGFFGATTHLYHKQPPTGWERIEGDLLPRAFDFKSLLEFKKESCEISDEIKLTSFWPKIILTSSAVQLGLLSIRKEQISVQAECTFQRHSQFDQVFFSHHGSGQFVTDFGVLKFRKGSYVYIPKCSTYQIRPDSDASFLVIQSPSQMGFPDRGAAGAHSCFDLGVIQTPLLISSPKNKSLECSSTTWTIEIIRSNRITRISYPYNPCEIAGWKGTIFPWELNVDQIRPIISPRYHLPPSVHTTLIGSGFVICTFAPRPTETGDPGALKVPFFHRNVDYDEIIFYHDGEFFSRSGIEPGSLTFHPSGIHHGPHPKALKNQDKKLFTNEYAVMVDVADSFEVCQQALPYEMVDYWASWMEK